MELYRGLGCFEGVFEGFEVKKRGFAGGLNFWGEKWRMGRYENVHETIWSLIHTDATINMETKSAAYMPRAVTGVAAHKSNLNRSKGEFSMKKKLTTLSLTLLLALTLFTAGAPVQAKEPLPDPTPVVTIQPGDPDKPEEPPAEPMGDPGDNGCLPDPKPIGRGLTD